VGQEETTKPEEANVELRVHPSALRLESEYRKLKAEGPGAAVGVATSMEKILPRDMPFEFVGACLHYECKQESLSENEKKWLADAKALGVPEGFVTSLKEYSRDPKVLYAWRNRMGDLIDESGMVDVNPWGTHFNVRGFESN
jgi:hypothetical protein